MGWDGLGVRRICGQDARLNALAAGNRAAHAVVCAQASEFGLWNSQRPERLGGISEQRFFGRARPTQASVVQQSEVGSSGLDIADNVRREYDGALSGDRLSFCSRFLLGNVTSVNTTLQAGTDMQRFCYDEQIRRAEPPKLGG